MRPARLCAIAALIALLTLTLASPALAAGHGGPPAGDILGIGHLIGGVLGSIGGAVLGGLKWTVGVAAKFLLATLGGLVKLLIPKSWANDALGVMHWIVAVPNYAGTITTPGGGHVYGFSGINALRDLFTWIAAALLPLTLTFGTTRAMFGSGDHPTAPLARVITLAGVLIFYPWWWSQGAAVINQITNFIFALHPVTVGLDRLMQIAVGGAIVAGWPLGGVLVMGAVGFTLLALIFLKVVIILAGAILYATGPLVLALAPTESGVQVARAWLSAALALLALPLLWAATFAVGALLINDTNRAGVLVGGSGTIAHLLGGLLVGLAGLASLWLCIKIAREVGGVLRTQLGGLLALAHSRRSSSSTSTAPAAATAANSLRSFGSRVGHAGGAAAGALSASGPVGAAAGRIASGAAAFARGGLIGVAASGARAAGAAAAPGAAALIGRSRAGAVAVQMGRAARGSWQQTSPSQRHNGAAKPAAPGHSSQSSTATPSAATAGSTPGASASAAATAKPGGPQPAGSAPSAGPRRHTGSSPASGRPSAPAGTPASTPGQTPRAPSASPPSRSSTRASARPAQARTRSDGPPAPPAAPAAPKTSSPRPPARPPRQPTRDPKAPKR